MKTFFNLFLFVMALSSCTKQHFPGEGAFTGNFSGSYTKEGHVIPHKRIIHIVITESSDDRLKLINSESGANHHESELTQKGKDISGTIKSWADVSWHDSPTTHISHIDKYTDIEGRWEKLDGEYMITGHFNSFYHFVSTAANIDMEYPVEGSFIIKPSKE